MYFVKIGEIKKPLWETADNREMSLPGRIKIGVDMLRPLCKSPVDSYTFSWDIPKKDSSRAMDEFSFTIKNDSSIRIRVPSATHASALKVEDAEIQEKINSVSTKIVFKCKNKSEDRKVSEILVDWVGKLINARKFSPPPISIVEQQFIK